MRATQEILHYLSIQLSNGHDSDQGGNGWTSVLNITFGMSVYIYRGGHGGGGVLNTAAPQKKLTYTASPQEKSTKHRHRNSYF